MEGYGCGQGNGLLISLPRAGQGGEEGGGGGGCASGGSESVGRQKH